MQKVLKKIPKTIVNNLPQRFLKDILCKNDDYQKDINKYLNQIEELNKNQNKLRTSNVKNGTIVHRGIRYDPPKDWKVGKRFYFGEFISTSLDINVAKRF